MSVLARPQTACVGRCSHNVGDAICRGCGRTIEEVLTWNTYSAEQRRAMIATCRDRIKTH